MFRTCTPSDIHQRTPSEPMAEKNVPRKEMVEFSAMVPLDLYNRFKARVPHYGGTSWFLNAALSAFVKRIEDDPSLEEQVGASVEAMLNLNRLSKEAAV